MLLILRMMWGWFVLFVLLFFWKLSCLVSIANERLTLVEGFLPLDEWFLKLETLLANLLRGRPTQADIFSCRSLVLFTGFSNNAEFSHIASVFLCRRFLSLAPLLEC